MSSEIRTPMMEQHFRMKDQIPKETMLLFRLGDFYELFHEDAKEGASLLGLTLTQRNGIPMCGVPQHAVEGYIGKLIQAGKRVAICDQVSEPKPGQVVERKITAILTPGCATSLELAQPKEHRYLAAVQKIGSQSYAFAFLEMTTGDFCLTQLNSEQGLHDEILRLAPKEILFPAQQNTIAWPGGADFTRSPSDDSAFDTINAQQTLLNHFKVGSLDGFGCKEIHIGPAGALIHYVTRTLQTSARHVLSLKTYSTENYLTIDPTTQRNLELIQSVSQFAASDTTLFHAIDQSVTPMGGRLLKSWILHPLRDVNAIEARQQVIAQWLKQPEGLESFRTLLEEVRDIERLIARISQASANARDVRALAHSLGQLPQLKKISSLLQAPLAEEMTLYLKEQTEIIGLIEQAIVQEPPLSLKEGGIIRQGYHAELDELRRAMSEGKDWVAQLQAREQARTGIKSLKVRFNHVFGYYIEITSSNLAQVPSDYIRKQTMVNAERFITPELKEMEGKILGAEERARKLEYELFLAVREQVAIHTREIQAAARALAALDVLAGWAIVAKLWNYCRPHHSNDESLKMVEGRHPVLEQNLRQQRFIANDLDMNEATHRLMILTGPNMAGKSTYIRQVALICLLFHIGCYVPAREAQIPIMDRIFTRIGASDDLSRGQSTFMVEMNETAYILHHATEKSLVILDEIGRGTSTFDGLSIAWAVAEHLNEKIKAKTLFATHYHELTELALLFPSIQNYHVAVRESGEQITFLRKIVPGGADQSYGIHVARLAGLPQPVLARAQTILDNLEAHELDAAGNPTLLNSTDSTAPASFIRSQRKTRPISQMDFFEA